MLSLPPPPATLGPPPPDGALVPAGLGASGRRRVVAVEPVEALRDSVQARYRRPAPRPADMGGEAPRGPRRTAPAGLPTRGRTPLIEGVLGASSGFLVQVIGQERGLSERPLARHRDAAVLGSEAYRRAGGQPPLYSEQPTVFRITV